ncbi:hypothetical protein [Kocuria rosea]|nr:hypothetical protein [Kocuria rosea]
MGHKTIDTRRADYWPTRSRKARKRARKPSQDGNRDTRGGRDQ